MRTSVAVKRPGRRHLELGDLVLDRGAEATTRRGLAQRGANRF
jgi:hypothetical protein